MYRRNVLASVVNESSPLNPPEEHSFFPTPSSSSQFVKEDTASSPELQYSPRNSRKGPMRRHQKQMVHKLHRCMARSGVAAVAASASMLSRHMESISHLDSASKFRCRGSCGRGSATALASRGLLATVAAAFASSVTNASSLVVSGVARLCHIATDLANAIGEPPWRMAGNQAAAGIPDEQRETPLVLLWAVNVAIVLVVAIIILVAWGFIEQIMSNGSINDEEVEEGPFLPGEPETRPGGSSSPALTEARHLRCGVKALVVTTLSFLSGMGLSVIHPLQSALLCGI